MDQNELLAFSLIRTVLRQQYYHIDKMCRPIQSRARACEPKTMMPIMSLDTSNTKGERRSGGVEAERNAKEPLVFHNLAVTVEPSRAPKTPSLLMTTVVHMKIKIIIEFCRLESCEMELCEPAARSDMSRVPGCQLELWRLKAPGSGR